MLVSSVLMFLQLARTTDARCPPLLRADIQRIHSSAARLLLLLLLRGGAEHSSNTEQHTKTTALLYSRERVLIVYILNGS